VLLDCRPVLQQCCLECLEPLMRLDLPVPPLDLSYQTNHIGFSDVHQNTIDTRHPVGRADRKRSLLSLDRDSIGRAHVEALQSWPPALGLRRTFSLGLCQELGDIGVGRLTGDGS
jgi:hypothetical protein